MFKTEWYYWIKLANYELKSHVSRTAQIKCQIHVRFLSSLISSAIVLPTLPSPSSAVLLP